MKVFQITESDWYAAETAEEARAEYRRNVGAESAEELFEYFGDPVELADADLDRLTVTEVDEPGQPKYTFREALCQLIARGAKAGFIATSEY